MNVDIYYFETKKDKEVEVLVAEYVKRIRWKIQLKRLDASSASDPNKCKQEEARLLLPKLSNSYVVCLSEEGGQYGSVEFAETLMDISNRSHKNVAFVIGGAFGIDDELKKQANLMISLSKMTFPHKLARLLLVEQLYRSYMLGQNKSYHI